MSEGKYQTVIRKNTFYFFDSDFEERYEATTVDAISNLLVNLRLKIDQEGVKRAHFEDLLLHPNGLQAILALNGLSQENLKRIITIARIINDDDLNILLHRSKWPDEGDNTQQDVIEWSTERVIRLIRENAYVRCGIVNLFFEGASNPALARIVRPFELKKLSVRKLRFDVDAMIDTLVRYKEKGSGQAQQKNNAENLIREILGALTIPYSTGDLPHLAAHAPGSKRTLDFIIPDKDRPQVIIECSFLSTTSSGQGDKAKTEIRVGELIRTHYPDATFIGFVDGIGWYVRKEDLRRMVSAYDDVFTFHNDELARFASWLGEVLEAWT